MALKAEYIAGRGGPEIKGTYRQLQLDAENQLTGAGCEPSVFTTEALHGGVSAEFFTKRRQNVQVLVRGCCKNAGLKPLFVEWPTGATPLALLLAFRSTRDRDAFRSELRDHDIYCPVHWEVQGECLHAVDLASRMLTVPADHRYTSEDVQRVVKVMCRVCDLLKG